MKKKTEKKPSAFDEALEKKSFTKEEMLSAEADLAKRWEGPRAEKDAVLTEAELEKMRKGSAYGKLGTLDGLRDQIEQRVNSVFGNVNPFAWEDRIGTEFGNPPWCPPRCVACKKTSCECPTSTFSPHHPMLAPRQRAQSETGWIGFSETVTCLAVMNIKRQPMLPFRPTRLVVDPGCAGAFDLTDFRMGNRHVGFVTSDPVPATGFPPIPANASPGDLAEWLRAQRIDCGTVSVAQQILLGVHNTSGTTARFQAILWGVTTEAT